MVYGNVRRVSRIDGNVAGAVVFGFVLHYAETGQSAEFGGAGHPDIAGGAFGVIASRFYVVFHDEIAIAGGRIRLAGVSSANF